MVLTAFLCTCNNQPKYIVKTCSFLIASILNSWNNFKTFLKMYKLDIVKLLIHRKENLNRRNTYHAAEWQGSTFKDVKSPQINLYTQQSQSKVNQDLFMDMTS